MEMLNGNAQFLAHKEPLLLEAATAWGGCAPDFAGFGTDLQTICRFVQAEQVLEAKQAKQNLT